jgi:hypothetical protein
MLRLFEDAADGKLDGGPLDTWGGAFCSNTGPAGDKSREKARERRRR